MDRIQVIRGMRDLLPDQTAWWQRLERTIIEVLDRYGFGEIRTPLLEQADLFARSIGEDTDIVEKEMYTFQDRDGSRVTLRPEGTASVVRSYIENSRWNVEPVSRWYYLGPMFRHERPQKGRYRQFWQLGVELLGAAEPAADVEVVDLMVELARAVGLTGTAVHLNSLGCPACRPAYRAALKTYLDGHVPELCENCRRRMATNPLRVLDCKEEGCRRVAGQAPRMLEMLCQDCAEHFRQVRTGLDALAVSYEIDHRLIRGLDYYTRTAFELLAEGLGAQNAVAGGGRYDGLVESLGGPSVPAIGFAAGLDRILLRLMDLLPVPGRPPGVFIVTMNEAGWRASLPLMQKLRRAGLHVESDVRRGSMKSQMKRADKLGSRLVLILGDEELAQGTVTLRDMGAAGEGQEKQVQVALGEISGVLLKRLWVMEDREGEP